MVTERHQRRSPSSGKRRPASGPRSFIENLRIAADLGAHERRCHIVVAITSSSLALDSCSGRGARGARGFLDILTSSRSTPTNGSQRQSRSTSTTSTPPSRNSTPVPRRRSGAHAHTWSVIASAYAAFNRHELPPTTPDWVNVDHRRVIAFAPGDMAAYIRATWDVAPGIGNHIVDVHRLSDIGAVFTQAVAWDLARGLRRRVAGRWHLLTVEGDLINRSEIFDEADLDAALARFDELSRPAPRLENAASRVCERFQECFGQATGTP